MRKILNLIFITLLFLLVSCSATITTPESYKVKFDTDRGSYVESQYIKGGQCASLPATPIKSDYDFEYWMLNGKEFDFSTPITSNITLVAKWKLSEDHVHKYIETVIKPECLNQGYTNFECSCGNSYKDNYIDALGHDIIYHQAKEPTENNVGWEAYVSCNRCNYSTYKELPKLENNECKHNVSSYWSANEDKHWHICNICSNVIDEESHCFGEWTIIQSPTINSTGAKAKTCLTCKYYIVESIPAIEIDTGETTGDTVVFAKVPADWSIVNCYYWHNEAGTDNMNPDHKTSWPGVTMTLVDEAENIWAFIVPAGTANVIFNNGIYQTGDTPFATAANLYILSDAAGRDGKFTVNVGSYDYTGSLDKIAKYATRGEIVTQLRTIYVQLPQSWPALYLYFWGSQETCAGWPGLPIYSLISSSKNIYSFQLPNDATGFVLSNGLGGEDNQIVEVITSFYISAYIVTEGTPKDNVTPAFYDDGVFIPV